MLIHRTITGVILIVLLIATVFYFPVPIVAIVIALLIGSGIWEFYCLAENKDLKPYKIFGILAGAFLSSAIYIVRARNYSVDANEILSLILFIILALALVKYVFKKDGTSVIINSAVTMLGILYVSFLFTFVIKLRYITNSDAGKGWVMSLFIITKVSDISAYFVGTKFGKHKLIPRISAKKSIEGSVGSIAGALIVSMLLTQCFLKELTLGMAALLGLLLGIMGQAGDLIESLMKRDARAKDSGKFVPGLGGVLDFMDSILFAGPVMYIFFLFIKSRLIV